MADAARRFDLPKTPVERHELDAEIDALRAAIEHVRETLLGEHERTHEKLAECRDQMERMERIIASAAAALGTLSFRHDDED